MERSSEQLNQAPEALSVVELIAQQLLSDLQKFAEPVSSLGSTTFLLVNPSAAKATYELYGPCDAINRDMLDRVYAQVGIDKAHPEHVEEVSKDGEGHKFVTYRLSSTATITERFFTSEALGWQRFCVTGVTGHVAEVAEAMFPKSK